MKWAIVFGFTLLLAIMFLYEWPKINPKQNKEKITFIFLIAMSWILAVVLLFYPETPGPTELVERIYKPLGKMLE